MNREQIALLNVRIENYNKKIRPQQAEVNRYKAWIQAFHDYQATPALSRTAMENIIDKVYVDSERKTQVTFLCK